MNEHESKVARLAVLCMFALALTIIYFVDQSAQREHDERMQALSVENAHPGIWRKP